MNIVDGVETDETGKPIFVGESLSLKDRTIVRTVTTNWLKECMANRLGMLRRFQAKSASR